LALEDDATLTSFSTRAEVRTAAKCGSSSAVKAEPAAGRITRTPVAVPAIVRGWREERV
jgi:hypothetical protein